MTKFVTTRPVAQGDLLFIPVNAIPAGAKKAAPENGVYILGHSETGHNHVIERTRAEVYEAADDAFVAYVRALGDGADVVHKRGFDTHETVSLAPGGLYEVRRQREYIPEGFRRAAD